MALKLGKDKAQHCYSGCRISQSTDEKTAIYVGWYKELQDITNWGH